MKTTNSSFRTAEEKTIARDIVAAYGLEGLRNSLVAVGLSPEEATEYCDDPNAIPTSIRRLLVAKLNRPSR